MLSPQRKQDIWAQTKLNGKLPIFQKTLPRRETFEGWVGGAAQAKWMAMNKLDLKRPCDLNTPCALDPIVPAK